MFPMKMIFILGVCLTICCQIRSSSAWGATTIESLTKRIKSFLVKVKKLDSKLTWSAAIKDFEKIKFKIDWFTSIQSNKTYLNQFRTEYDKLKTYTTNVINSLEYQMKNIGLAGRWVGTQTKRIKLCKYYKEKFSTKLTIKGAGAEDTRIKQIDRILKSNQR